MRFMERAQCRRRRGSTALPGRGWAGLGGAGLANTVCENQQPFQKDASMRPRVLSGMRPTGALHLGHDHGAL